MHGGPGFAGEPRDRDRGDIERLLRAYRGQVDLGRIRGLVAEVAAALEEPERPAEFDRLVRQALGES